MGKEPQPNIFGIAVKHINTAGVSDRKVYYLFFKMQDTHAGTSKDSSHRWTAWDNDADSILAL